MYFCIAVKEQYVLTVCLANAGIVSTAETYVFGQPNVPYDVEVTDDFVTWFPMADDPDDPYVDPDGNFVFEDNFAPLYPKGFYRLVERLP